MQPSFLFFTDATSFTSLLELSNEYQTAWLNKRISNYFLEKDNCGIVELGIKVLCLADQFEMYALKDRILKNHVQQIRLNFEITQSTMFKKLSEDIRFILLKSNLIQCLRQRIKSKQGIQVIEALDEVLDAILNKKEPTKSKSYKLPFQNVFEKADEQSNIEIRVDGKHSLHLHQIVLKRLGGTLGEMILDDKEKNIHNIYLDNNENVEVFLLMVRFMYPKHFVNLSLGKLHWLDQTISNKSATNY